MSYDWETIPSFLGFDIIDLRTGDFLGYDIKTRIFQELNIPTVPFVNRLKVKEFSHFTISDDTVPNTKWPEPSSTDLKAEGIVFKNYSKQIFGKYVRDKFKERNREVFGGSKKHAKNDDEVVVAIYCTTARIEKVLFKLIDDGKKLDMTMMHHLPKSVLTDIYEENWQEICFSRWSLNFRNIQKKTSKRCLEVLKQIIVNNALNKDETHTN